ncbi:MAG: hypothetical protein F4X84_07080 [Synechococcus sp. SB0662_bin_45]|nr:hypothetical protein [Cyanobacteria bacterium MAG IRC3_bin_20]MDE0647823.1 hypothetical protein [Cyanobacteria bacterium MAG IRC4_bin_6]MXW12090.1 hypothetical protein [Synechococcus sp. SB0668_bin_13]MXY18428.1 hypothetical protein [Synechococcus sp. SB0664_bin_36]MYE22096.1 hypothetical protein [Synechococcus sp. SB0662_bin_45]MYF36869.1 hypothetical protein [Synechococcus sp. SB0678_bin_12]MYG64351.1 hypothetical protein [Synechococcus sp. SB0675_bin_7]MYI87934.1 hypothetical protein [
MGQFTDLLQTCKTWMDRVLMVNVFVVMAGALWFVVAVGFHSQGLEQPLGQFQQLWTPLFMPAIGLLMAAALLNGGLQWLLRFKKRREQSLPGPRATLGKQS